MYKGSVFNEFFPASPYFGLSPLTTLPSGPEGVSSRENTSILAASGS